MTKQELFDKSLNHIKAQGGPGWCPESGCQYTTLEGKHCAAWPFLSEAARLDVHTTGNWKALEDHLKQPEVLDFEDFIDKLQRVHDTSAEDSYTNECKFMPLYLGRMEELATTNGLIFKE